MRLTPGLTTGRLLLIERVTSGVRPKWLVKCSCGVQKLASEDSLRAGSTKSCGCLRKDLVAAKNFVHGGSKERMYRVWRAIIERCTDPECPSWANYGGRGINICARWLNSYSAFRRDVGTAPGPGYSLERSNNNKGYSPSNVLWATRGQQARNTRRTLLITYKKRTMCLKDWSVELGIPYGCLLYRIRQRGMDPVEAFESPSRYAKSRKEPAAA